MKNFAIFSSELIFLILAFLEKFRQKICRRICLILAIIDLKVVLRKLLSPANLSGAQTLCIYKTTEIVIVCKDKNLMLVAFQVVAPSLEYLNNS